MAEKFKLSFKKGPRNTGLAAIATPRFPSDIKCNRRKVGNIIAPSRFGGDYWVTQIAVMKDPAFVTVESPCPWKWIGIKNMVEGNPLYNTNRFDTEEEARAAIERMWDKVTAHYKLNYFED